jgi:hypothetical protein
MQESKETLNVPDGSQAAGHRTGFFIALLLALPAFPISELRTAIDADGIAGDPPGIFGGQESDNAADVAGLREAL